MGVEENKALTRRIVEEFLNKNNQTLADELIAEDFVFHTSLWGVSPDREGLKQLTAGLHLRYPDAHYTIEEAIGENDKVAELMRLTGTHPETEKKIDVSYVFISRIQGGKLKERWGIVNEMEIMRQLGFSAGKGYQGLKSVTYRVPDIEKAKNWYAKVFNLSPIYDSPFLVVFLIGDSTFALSLAANTTLNSADSIVVYWGVDNIDSEYKRLQELGAKVHTEITSGFDMKIAIVIDPFGNLFGIRAPITDKNKSSVEQEPSQTARGVTYLRALAAIDEREEIRGNDFMAELFLPDDRKSFLKDNNLREIIKNQKPVMYEYILARTAFFDHIYEKALRENISQITAVQNN